MIRHATFRFLWVTLSLMAILSCGGYKKAARTLPVIKADPTTERIRRGDYLANQVFVCMDCHSQRDMSRFSGPPLPGTSGGGGMVFDKKMGFPGRLVSPNITPFALSAWTDGEIYRAITTGVDRDGKALAPVMPYQTYGQADPEDIQAIIAYLRSLPAISHDPPPSKMSLPVRLAMKSFPEPARPMPKPRPEETIAYGKYLAENAGCYDCHSPGLSSKKKERRAWTGGFVFKLGNGDVVRSTNLTPDAETGIGDWSRTAFIDRFKKYEKGRFEPHPVRPGDFQTMMPWTMYAGMTSQDLGAIYDYLRTLKPVKNRVERFSTKVD